MNRRYVQLLTNRLAIGETDPSAVAWGLDAVADAWSRRVLGDDGVRLHADVGVPSEIVDRQGHRRPAYRGLFVYAARQADPTLDLSAWGEYLEAALGDAPLPLVAGAGAQATRIAWDALAIGALSGWGRVAKVFDPLVTSRRPSGQLLGATGADNPETHWFHELVLLHAAGSYAAHTGSPALRDVCWRAAEFHQDQTQPDHATAQPWALWPMIWNPITHPLADQILHAASTQHPAGVRGVSRILLADALACLGRVPASGY